MDCTTESTADSYRMMAGAAKLSLAASAGAFVTAGFGCVVNQVVPDAICADGLAVVGCFYFIIGVVDLIRVRRWNSVSRITESNEQTSRNKI